MESVISRLSHLSLTQFPPPKQISVSDYSVSNYSVNGKMGRKKEKIKGGEKKKKKKKKKGVQRKRGSTNNGRGRGRLYPNRQVGGGWMGVALAVGRRAIPVIARGGITLGRKLLPKAAKYTVKHLPKAMVSSVAQSIAGDALEKELKKRAAKRYGLLGSLRYAAAEKLMEQQKWAEKQRMRIRRKEDAAIAIRRAKQKRRNQRMEIKLRQRLAQIKRSKQDAHRQLHVSRALTRRRRMNGLPST